MRIALLPRLADTVRELEGSFAAIPAARRELLEQLARYVSSNDPALLVFICTHNSRRSHMAQIWAQTAAASNGLSTVRTYSGGTEATAFDRRAVAAMRRAGFEIESGQASTNPVYRVRWSLDAPAVESFSKRYDQRPNPVRGLCAVMTCSDADAGCPVVTGATARIVLTYLDPKAFDGSESETEQYDARCREIGREMLYAFSRVA